MKFLRDIKFIITNNYKLLILYIFLYPLKLFFNFYSFLSQKKRANSLVILIDDASQRFYKITKCLLENDINLILLANERIINHDLIKKLNIKEKFFFQNEFELAKKIFNFRNNNFYYFCQGGYLYGNIALLIKKNKFYFDNYDQYTGIFDKINFIKKNLELNLVNKADLVVSRGLELNHLKNKNSKNIFFPDYIDQNNYSINNNKKNTDFIDICYIGKIKPSIHWGNNLWYDQKDDQVIKWFSNFKNIRYHIFPSSSLDKKSITEYKTFCEKYENIFFYTNLNYEDLLLKLKSYDFGIANFEFGVPECKPLVKKLKYSMANKIYDYLETGLGIIYSTNSINYENFTQKFMKHYNFAVEIDTDKNYTNEDLFKILNKKRNELNFNKINNLFIQKHIKRLIKKMEL